MTMICRIIEENAINYVNSRAFWQPEAIHVINNPPFDPFNREGGAGPFGSYFSFLILVLIITL